jgi:hypothetical protein
VTVADPPVVAHPAAELQAAHRELVVHRPVDRHQALVRAAALAEPGVET